MIRIIIEMPAETVKVLETTSPAPEKDTGTDKTVLVGEFPSLYHLSVHYDWKLNELDATNDVAYYIGDEEIFPEVWAKDGNIGGGLTTALIAYRNAQNKT